MPRRDKRWIQSRVEEEPNQVVRFTEWQEVPHWTLDQHEHRQELTRIIHGATEAVTARKIKPRKLYVTEEILEASAHRARLIRSKSREEKQAKRLDQKRVIAAWKQSLSLDCRSSASDPGTSGDFSGILIENSPKTARYQCSQIGLAQSFNRKSKSRKSRGCGTI